MIFRGMWPVMITPYTADGSIDFESCRKLIAWYAQTGATGVFACCQSSEIFYLCREERAALAKCCVEACRENGLPVLLSNHVEEDLTAQAEELRAMAELEPDALVLITNRLVAEDEEDAVFQERMLCLLQQLPEQTPLGLYECPHPYNRLLSAQLLKWCVDTGRFICMKDTTCSVEKIAEKLQAVAGSEFLLYNADTPTLLGSLRLGAAGLAGPMLNFHPKLYGKLLQLHDLGDPRAERLQRQLAMMGLSRYYAYPLNAKYMLNLHGVPMEISTRMPGVHPLDGSTKCEMEHMFLLAQEMEEEYGFIQ